MIYNGLQDGVHTKTENNKHLKRFKALLGFLVQRNFSKSEEYNDIVSSSNQLAQLYGTVKTRKFDDVFRAESVSLDQ